MFDMLARPRDGKIRLLQGCKDRGRFPSGVHSKAELLLGGSPSA